MNQIYKKGDFIIVKFLKGKRTEYMVVNTRKASKEGFKKAHTHLKSYEMSKHVIEQVRKGKINTGLSIYLLGSLKRLSEDLEYVEKVNTLIATKKNRRNKAGYRNQMVGIN